MPHTKQQLQALLAEAGLQPRHQWGQNFLIDLNLMRLLVDAADPQPDDLVLEVGPGPGSLTDLLAQRAAHVIAVEIDPDLARIAQQQLASHANVTLLQTDILARKSALAPVVLDALEQYRPTPPGRFLLVANLPYQIASPLIINLLIGPNPPQGIYVTIQAEVADRMTAAPSTKAFGQLSVLLQATGSVRRLRTLKPQAFWPMPTVHSAMIAYQRDDAQLDLIGDRLHFRRTIDLLLHHRRKTIRHCLAQACDPQQAAHILNQLDIPPSTRAETLTPQQFIQLAHLLPPFPQ